MMTMMRMLLERIDDHSGNVRLLSPTIFRRIVNLYPDMEVRIEPGDTYGIQMQRGILGVDIVGYSRRDGNVEVEEEASGGSSEASPRFKEDG